MLVWVACIRKPNPEADTTPTARHAMRTTLALLLISVSMMHGFAAEPAAPAAVNDKCPVTGKPVNPKCTYAYEDRTYAFCTGDCRKKFEAARADSLYEKIGGKAAIGAAVDLFYTKVLADDRINFFFEDVNMSRQHNKQKAFLGAALGGPVPWEGKDMRTAHASLDGLNDSHFDAVAGHLLATLEELKVKRELIDQVMAIVASTRDDVLNRGQPAK